MSILVLTPVSKPVPIFPSILGNGRCSFRALLVVLAAALLLGGCSQVRQAAGVDRTPPDEFRVPVRAPLSMPTDFGLRAPASADEAVTEARRQDEARQVVLESRPGRNATGPRRMEGLTEAESSLLAALGAERVDPQIRVQIERETRRINESERGLVDSILFWKSQPPPGTVVDAARERQRLQEGTALGRSPVEGETPIIERRRSGGLF